MIKTEDQRRWWFATHPEFSWKKSSRRSRPERATNQESEKVPPEVVDEWIDEALEYEKDRTAVELLKLWKFWFGTEFESKSTDEKHALLWGDDDESISHYNSSEKSRRYAQSTGPSVAAKETSDQSRDESNDEELQRSLEAFNRAIELDKKGLESDPHTLLDLLPLRRLIMAPVEAAKALLKRTAQGQVLNAVKKGGGGGTSPPKPNVGAGGLPATPPLKPPVGGGPGEWVEVQRSRVGLEHQSKMSGQPIRESSGKFYIKEYDL